MEEYIDKARNIYIKAKKIEIGNGVSFGSDVKVAVNGIFQIGDFSRLGSDCEIAGNNIKIGRHLFNSSGLRVGGGGREYPSADLTIGDRCTIHNNFLNVCEPIVIDDDVGLSPETAILTHGYWQSVLDGYPASFSGVHIGSGVIIGYRSLVMMGVSIAENCVIGGQSVVTKSLRNTGIYGGSPARFINEIVPLAQSEKIVKAQEILKAYEPLAFSRGIEFAGNVRLEYPLMYVKDFQINLETFDYSGVEDSDTDDLRDFLRKWGIRIYTERGFVAKPRIL